MNVSRTVGNEECYRSIISNKYLELMMLTLVLQ